MLPSCLHAQVAVKPFYDAMLRDTPVFYESWSLMAHTMAREGKNSHATGSAWLVHFSYGFPRLLSAPPSCTTGLDTGDQVLEMARGKIDMSFRAASHWFGASALVNGSARCMEVLM